MFRSARELGELLGPTGLATLLAQTEGAARGLKCPACEVEGLEVAFHGWFVDVCGNCHGAFADFGESIARSRRPPARSTLWEKLRAALRKKDLAVGEAAQPYEDYTLVEVLSVPNTHPEKLATLHRTKKGAPYLLEASGEVSLWSLRRSGVDAMYCDAVWRVGPVPQKWANLRVNEGSLEDLSGLQIAYQKSHLYRVPFQGTGKVLSFHMSDAVESWMDNSGAITVRLYAKR